MTEVSYPRGRPDPAYHWKITDRNGEQVATADRIDQAMFARAHLLREAEDAGAAGDVRYAVRGPYAGWARDATGDEDALSPARILDAIVECVSRRERDVLARALAVHVDIPA